MALNFCYIIAYLQIMSAGFNLWGTDPLLLLNMPLGRNTILVGLFQVAYLLGLAGAILTLQNIRLGFVLSIFHHLLLLPALVITGLGLVMMMDDRVNLTLLYMSQPTGADASLYWSLGWGTVFKQVTQNVPTGSTYIGVNLVAVLCVVVLRKGIMEIDDAEEELRMEMRRERRQAKRARAQLALPPPQAFPKQQGMRQQPRMAPRGASRPPR